MQKWNMAQMHLHTHFYISVYTHEQIQGEREKKNDLKMFSLFFNCIFMLWQGCLCMCMNISLFFFSIVTLTMPCLNMQAGRRIKWNSKYYTNMLIMQSLEIESSWSILFSGMLMIACRCPAKFCYSRANLGIEFIPLTKFYSKFYWRSVVDFGEIKKKLKERSNILRWICTGKMYNFYFYALPNETAVPAPKVQLEKCSIFWSPKLKNATKTFGKNAF